MTCKKKGSTQTSALDHQPCAPRHRILMGRAGPAPTLQSCVLGCTAPGLWGTPLRCNPEGSCRPERRGLGAVHGRASCVAGHWGGSCRGKKLKDYTEQPFPGSLPCFPGSHKTPQYFWMQRRGDHTARNGSRTWAGDWRASPGDVHKP